MFHLIFRRRIRRVRNGRRTCRQRRSTRSRDYLARKEAARKLVESRIPQLVAEYAKIDPAYAAAMQHNRLAIRNTRSRWGSCSSRKNLNFNYRILDLPPHLQDYVIVHELCHLKELHHGRAFWELMEQTIPDAKKRHALLRRHRIGDTIAI